MEGRLAGASASSSPDRHRRRAAVKIKKLSVFPLEYPEAVDNNSTRYVVMVRAEAADGTVGWGEAFTLFREATAASAAIIREGLAELVIGESAYEIERHWSAMRERVWWYGHTGGIAAFAISAIDMALWDLKGKLLDLNLSQSAISMADARRTGAPPPAGLRELTPEGRHD
jgi:L-alanine-DL-glutamate epimerase-like enolase superfamily enzyme